MMSSGHHSGAMRYGEFGVEHWIAMHKYRDAGHDARMMLSSMDAF
jgi:hypothetical protein